MIGKDIIPISINTSLKVNIDGVGYGVLDEPHFKRRPGDPVEFPKEGISIPQMAGSILKVAFQRNPDPIEVKEGEIGLIPFVVGCEGVILTYTDKKGALRVLGVHNTASIMLSDDALYKAFLNRKGGDKKAFPELKQLLNKNLQPGFGPDAALTNEDVDKLLNGITKPIFNQIFVIALTLLIYVTY